MNTCFWIPRHQGLFFSSCDSGTEGIPSEPEYISTCGRSTLIGNEVRTVVGILLGMMAGMDRNLLVDSKAYRMGILARNEVLVCIHHAGMERMMERNVVHKVHMMARNVVRKVRMMARNEVHSMVRMYHNVVHCRNMSRKTSNCSKDVRPIHPHYKGYRSSPTNGSN